MTAHRLLYPTIIMYLFTFLVIFLPLFHAFHGSFGAHQQMNIPGLFGFSSSYGKRRIRNLETCFCNYFGDTTQRHSRVIQLYDSRASFPVDFLVRQSAFFPIQLHTSRGAVPSNCFN